MKKNKQKDFEFMDTAAKSLYEVFWDSVREDEIAKRHRIELENIVLKKENEELKHQLAEKDKEIERIKKAFNQMRFMKNDKIKLLKKREIEYEQQLRHQVCQEIREYIHSKECKVKGMEFVWLLQKLDQIEGEKE